MVVQINPKKSTEPCSLSSAVAANREAFVPTMRELVRAYQAFTSYSDTHVRQLGLTPSQFDVIATLGGTSGMSMGDVAAKTLVTKGTLTGIIDRLEQKELVRREVPEGNRRSFTVVLTPTGEEVYKKVFPAHIAHLRQRFEQLDASELELLRVLLQKLRVVF
ncbi:MAG: MarR family transcriptional regulator [Leptolyngbyaceae cyanobacterium MO_188.B28]|nr:MarR family transcriptional regulator [Leptolyngbyaceae cyanobacterium MO_188.B28]